MLLSDLKFKDFHRQPSCEGCSSWGHMPFIFRYLFINSVAIYYEPTTEMVQGSGYISEQSR